MVIKLFHKSAVSSLQIMKSTVPSSLHHTSDSLSLRSNVNVLGLHLFKHHAHSICIASGE